MPSLCIIGNPENRRVTFCSEDARRLGWQVRIVPWIELLNTSEETWASRIAASIIRIESPGENSAVERCLISRGANATSADACLQFSGEYGRIESMADWFAGFCHVLEALARSNRDEQHGRWMNHPDDIMVMFDKARCQQLLRIAEIPVPQVYGFIESWSGLVQLMENAGVHRVFVKPPHSSSASGVIALQRLGTRWVAQTSVEVVCSGEAVRLYNSLDVKRYDDPETISRIVDELGKSGLHVEKWIPKAGFAGRTFDLRVLVVAGQTRHTVVRTSVTPMTNLHLGNARGDLDALRDLIPEVYWNAAMETCQRAALCFPGSLYTGIDLLFTPGFRSHCVLEANAFGDLLPGIMSRGESTYEAELKASAEHPSRSAPPGRSHFR
ncbi:MAG: STM4014 family protein [Planctomycetaceae bacterium]|nr:STM4014 family protein [Planctomycetaceae bacterium]